MFFRTADWTSDNGFSAHFGPPQYLLRDITDSLSGEAQIVKAPGQDGSTTYQVTLGRPVVNLTGSIHAVGATLDAVRQNLDRMQDELRRAFMPNRFGLLVDNRAGGSRQIRCRPIALPTFGPRNQGSRTVDVEFTADSPMWESVDETVQALGVEQGLFRFPLRLSTRMGLYVKNATIINETGDDLWPTIEIYTASAYVAVWNRTTEKKIEINRPVAQGQKIVIETSVPQASIWQQSASGAWTFVADVSNWLTVDSEYWSLVPGVNEITLNNEIVGGGMFSIIRYRVPM